MNIRDLIDKIEAEYEELEPGMLHADSEFKKLIYWNSMNSLVMIVMVEYEYKVLLKDDELKSINTVQQLAELLTAKGELHA
jgi:acyl carrier protein